MLEATRERRRVRIRYLKPGRVDADERTVCPYALVFASGRWYLLARCERSGEVRAFRVDRVLEASLTEESFEIPADFDPELYLSGGRVYRAEEEVEVVVRYSPRIARWIREHGPVEEQPDGSVVLRHRVADPRWAVRHVLQFGGDAQVLEPLDVRAMVAAAAERVLMDRGS